MIIVIKLILSILLLICLFPMPYGYYESVRFLAFIGFGFIAINAWKKDSADYKIIIFISLALLFQPFLKIALGRTLWNLVDIIVALWLLFNITKIGLKKFN